MLLGELKPTYGKELAFGRTETRLGRAITIASRPDKEHAYGEQNIRPSAEFNPAYGGQ